MRTRTYYGTADLLGLDWWNRERQECLERAAMFPERLTCTFSINLTTTEAHRIRKLWEHQDYVQALEQLRRYRGIHVNPFHAENWKRIPSSNLTLNLNLNRNL
jgi:hypothetical protein